MRRRDLLAGAAGVGLLGVGGAAYAVTRRPSASFSATVETLDAPGSSAGQLDLPIRGEPTLVDLFATWCGPCREEMDTLTSLHETYGGDVRFVSVTNEQFGGTLTRADVRSWWADNGGDWTVAHDPDGTLMRDLSASGLPYLAVVDADGQVTFTHAGLIAADRLGGHLDAVR